MSDELTPERALEILSQQMALGRYREVISLGTQLWQHFNSHVVFLTLAADAHFRLGELNECINLCLQVLRREPGNYFANFALFTSMQGMEDSSALYQIWLRALGLGSNGEQSENFVIELNTENYDTYELFLVMSKVAFQQGRFDQAVNIFSNCLAQPDRVTPHLSVETKYASLAENYDDAAYHRETVSTFLEFVTAHGGAQKGVVIDAACGTGLAGTMLRETADRLIGIDLSSEMITHAEHRAVYDTLICADMCDGLGQFDGDAQTVICLGATNYLDDLGRFLAGAAKALAPGGRLFFSDFPAAPSQGQLVTKGGTFRYCRSRDFVENLAANHGFTVGGILLKLAFGLPCHYWHLIRR